MLTNISQTLRVNNSRNLKIKNAKFSGNYFYINTNILRDFQICASVPLIGFTNPESTTGNVPPDNFYTDIFKNRISEIEKYLSVKNAMIDLSTSNSLLNPVMQSRTSTAVNITVKSLMAVTKLIMMTPYWKNQTMIKREKRAIIIGNSILNNINSRGLSKS